MLPSVIRKLNLLSPVALDSLAIALVALIVDRGAVHRRSAAGHLGARNLDQTRLALRLAHDRRSSHLGRASTPTDHIDALAEREVRFLRRRTRIIVLTRLLLLLRGCRTTALLFGGVQEGG